MAEQDNSSSVDSPIEGISPQINLCSEMVENEPPERTVPEILEQEIIDPVMEEPAEPLPGPSDSCSQTTLFPGLKEAILAAYRGSSNGLQNQEEVQCKKDNRGRAKNHHLTPTLPKTKEASKDTQENITPARSFINSVFESSSGEEEEGEIREPSVGETGESTDCNTAFLKKEVAYLQEINKLTRQSEQIKLRWEKESAFYKSEMERGKRDNQTKHHEITKLREEIMEGKRREQTNQRHVEILMAEQRTSVTNTTRALKDRLRVEGENRKTVESRMWQVIGSKDQEIRNLRDEVARAAVDREQMIVNLQRILDAHREQQEILKDRARTAREEKNLMDKELERTKKDLKQIEKEKRDNATLVINNRERVENVNFLMTKSKEEISTLKAKISRLEEEKQTLELQKNIEKDLKVKVNLSLRKSLMEKGNLMRKIKVLSQARREASNKRIEKLKKLLRQQQLRNVVLAKRVGKLDKDNMEKHQPKGGDNLLVEVKKDPVNQNTVIEEYVEEPEEEINKINPDLEIRETSLARTSKTLIEEFEEIVLGRIQTSNEQEPEICERPREEIHSEIDIKKEYETWDSEVTLENVGENNETMERCSTSLESREEEDNSNLKLENLQIRQPRVDIRRLWWLKKNPLPTIEIPDKSITTQKRKEIFCPLCRKIFRYRKERKRHERIYHNIVPIPCNICNRTFLRKNYLSMHQKSHEKKEPFVCSICKITFTRRGNLRKHVEKAHGNPPKPEEDKITGSFPPANTIRKE